MTPLTYAIEQLRLECIGIDPRGFMTRIAGPNPDEIHALYMVHSGDDITSFWRHDMFEKKAGMMTESDVIHAFTAPDAIASAFGLQHTWSGKTYVFSAETVLGSAESDVLVEDGCFVIRKHGSVICKAWSSRSNKFSSELAVETHQDFRRQGFARRTALAWARAQLDSGKIAFYTHKQTNTASHGLAKSLDVAHVFDSVGFA